MIEPREPFFPITMASSPSSDGQGFTNDILGGLSIKEGIALQCLQGLMANPALIGVQNADTLVVIALKTADRFIAHVNSELPPEKPEAPVSPIRSI